MYRHLQALAEDERRGAVSVLPIRLLRPRLVDECHPEARAREAPGGLSDYFQPAAQLSMTATPLREETRDTYLTPALIYQYSLRQDRDAFPRALPCIT